MRRIDSIKRGSCPEDHRHGQAPQHQDENNRQFPFHFHFPLRVRLRFDGKILQNLKLCREYSEPWQTCQTFLTSRPKLESLVTTPAIIKIRSLVPKGTLTVVASRAGLCPRLNVMLRGKD